MTSRSDRMNDLVRSGKFSRCPSGQRSLSLWGKLKRYPRAQSLGSGAAALALGLMVAGYDISTAESAELKVQIDADFGHLDPAFWQNRADRILIDSIFPKLIRFKPGEKLEWELSAAEAIDQVDAKTIRFKLKPGIMWTGGFGEVTAEDVKFSYERFLDDVLKAPNKGDWAILESVEVVDKYTGIIHLKEPSAGVWWGVLPFASGAIVSKSAVEKLGGKIGTDPGATAGPYELTKWVPGAQTSLTAHAAWGGAAPGYEQVTLIPINDSKSAQVAFEAGQVDMAKVAISSVPELKDNPQSGVKLAIMTSWGYTWVGLNMSNPKLADANVRNAIVKALDRKAIIQGAYFGVADPATGFVAPGLVGHREAALPDRDVEGAKALLEKAGVSSLDLDIEITNTTDDSTVAQIIQANLAEVGINLNINVRDIGTFWDLGSEKGQALELTLQTFTSPPDPAWSTQWFVSSQVGLWNWEWFQDKEFDTLHVAAAAELDTPKRSEMYQKMQQLMDDSATFFWLSHPVMPLMYRDSVDPALLANGDMVLSSFKPAK